MEDNAGHGRWDHRPLLDDARIPVLAGAAASLGTTEAAWASCTNMATPDRARVRVTTVNWGATPIVKAAYTAISCFDRMFG